MVSEGNRSSHKSKDYDLEIIDTIPYYESFHDESSKIIKTILNDPDIWLDTGCGTGTLVQKALEIFDNTYFILADPSFEMLDLAKNKLLKHFPDRVNFLEPIGTENIILEDDCKPDVITAIQSHHYMSLNERYEATKNCYRLLKHDGIFITFENVRPSTNSGVEIGKEYWKNFQESRGRDQKKVKTHLKRFDVEYFPITIEEHISLLKKSGFSIVEMFWRSYMQAGFYCIK
ncbi:MAG: class I SAM-dependent methyltransferase [Methanobacterium sp.]|uniref:class I SAM-dependent methyltransferase n=1 Tax=Methanobacterium sp. TaxID=2164 RepID=UPI003C76B4E0